MQQGLNIAAAASAPEVMKTLERFVYSSLADATKFSGGKLKEVYHFDSKAEVVRQIRNKFPDLAKRMSLLQMGHYVENWKTFGPMAPQRMEHGSSVMRRPTGEETEWQFVVAERDTGEFVRALVDLPAGTELLGVSEVSSEFPRKLSLS